MKITFLRHHLLSRSLSLLIAAVLFGAGAVCAGMTDAVKTETLPNGLKVIVLENHKAPVASFNVFYHVGSRNEQFGKTGISHLIEHLMFKGTKKLGPEEFSKIIQANGGEDNAMTSSDYTEYFENINRDRLSVPISLESDRMGNFDPKEFDKERSVVAEERRLRTDDEPEDALDEQVRAAAFVEHPYHWPVIGWMQDIQRLTLQDALAYHQIITRRKMQSWWWWEISTPTTCSSKSARHSARIKNGPKPPPMPEVEPEQEGERRVELRHAANLPAFEEAYHVPNIASPDAFALEIASEVLSDGKSARLYKKLVVDKRMVVEVGAGYDLTSFDPNLFVVSAQMRPGVKTDDAIAEADKEIAALRDEPVGAQELQKAKNLEQAEFVFSQDSILQEAMLLGVYQMLGSYKMIDQYLSNIDKVTAADVQRVRENISWIPIAPSAC